MILIESLLTKAGGSGALNEAGDLDGDFEVSKVLLTEKCDVLRGKCRAKCTAFYCSFLVYIHSSCVYSPHR